jgi:molybdate transport system regulatory protein
MGFPAVAGLITSAGRLCRSHIMPKFHPGPRKGRRGEHVEARSGAWEPRLRLWIDIGGHNAFGPGKVRLLEAIANTHSIAAAAKRLRMSYRQAWKHVKLIEERTGLTVVEPKRGGRSGGGTDLTADGRSLLAAYCRFREEVENHVASACHRHFAKWEPPDQPNAPRT